MSNDPRPMSPRVTIAGICAPGSDVVTEVYVLVDGKRWTPPIETLRGLVGLCLDSDELAVLVACHANDLIAEGLL